MANKLVQVKAPHFTAGFVSDGVRVTEAAPILKYLIGKTEALARHYLKQRGWTASVVSNSMETESERTMGISDGASALHAAD